MTPVYPVTGHVQHGTEVLPTATGAPRDTREDPPYGAARTAGVRGPLQTLDAHRRRRTGPAAGLVLLLAALWLPFGWPLGPAAATAAGNRKLDLAAGRGCPGSGTTQTVIDFAVEVSWKASCSPPQTVRVTIAGLASPTLALAPGQPSTATGTTTVTYTGQRTIGAAGTWTYEFAARLTAADPWVTLAGNSPAALTINVPSHPEADGQADAEAKTHSEADGQAHRSRSRPPSRPRRRRRRPRSRARPAHPRRRRTRRRPRVHPPRRPAWIRARRPPPTPRHPGLTRPAVP